MEMNEGKLRQREGELCPWTSPSLTRLWLEIYILELRQPQEVENLAPMALAYESSLDFRTV